MFYFVIIKALKIRCFGTNETLLCSRSPTKFDIVSRSSALRSTSYCGGLCHYGSYLNLCINKNFIYYETTGFK